MTLTPLEQVLGLIVAAALGLWGKPLVMAAFNAIFSRKSTPTTVTGTTTTTTTATGTTVNVNTTAKTPSLAPDSPSPAQLERERRSKSARAAGFVDTAGFDRANSLGDMRCNGHVLLAKGQEEITIKLNAVDKKLDAMDTKLDEIRGAWMIEVKDQARADARLDSVERDITRHEDRLNER